MQLSNRQQLPKPLQGLSQSLIMTLHLFSGFVLLRHDALDLSKII